MIEVCHGGHSGAVTLLAHRVPAMQFCLLQWQQWTKAVKFLVKGEKKQSVGWTDNGSSFHNTANSCLTELSQDIVAEY